MCLIGLLKYQFLGPGTMHVDSLAHLNGTKPLLMLDALVLFWQLHGGKTPEKSLHLHTIFHLSLGKKENNDVLFISKPKHIVALNYFLYSAVYLLASYYTECNNLSLTT